MAQRLCTASVRSNVNTWTGMPSSQEKGLLDWIKLSAQEKRHRFPNQRNFAGPVLRIRTQVRTLDHCISAVRNSHHLHLN